jgi:hypothetical protein
MKEPTVQENWYAQTGCGPQFVKTDMEYSDMYESSVVIKVSAARNYLRIAKTLTVIWRETKPDKSRDNLENIIKLTD